MRPEYLTELQALRARAQGGQGALFRYATPFRFYPLAGRLARAFGIATAAIGVASLVLVFRISSSDAAVADASRIGFVHLPAAWMSIWIYLIAAGWFAVGLILDTRLSAMMAGALAPTGALFTLLELWTGALWNKPVWGDWLIWDERLVCGIVLLAHFVAIVAIQRTYVDARRGDRAGALVALSGIVTVPLACVVMSRIGGSRLAPLEHLVGVSASESSLLVATVSVTLGFWAYTIAASMFRVRAIILERDRRAAWVRSDVLRERAPNDAQRSRPGR